MDVTHASARSMAHRGCMVLLGAAGMLGCPAEFSPTLGDSTSDGSTSGSAPGSSSSSQSNTTQASVRPFRIDVPEQELVELRQRINATKWPERETVTDAAQGVQLATIQKLTRYWATEYDWRKCEAKLNALP